MTAVFGERRDAAARLRAHRQDIAHTVTELFLQNHPDWLVRYGANARIRGREDATFHVEFLTGAVLGGGSEGFAEYARWTARVLSSRGISPEFLIENLEQVRDAVRSHLDPRQHALINDIVRAGLDAVRSSKEPGASDDSSNDTFRVARSMYVQAVKAGHRKAALNIALEALRSGASVSDVYVEIIQPVQYQIGGLWERNQITVAEEHVATAVSQFVIGNLYAHLDISDVARGNALVTGVSGELHQLGANMVADVLEADGWNVLFLGTQVPHQGVLEAIRAHKPQLIGISATVLFNLPAVADLVTDIRRAFGADPSVVVGGAAFRSSPGVWKEMGANGYGRDLRDAVNVANELFPKAAA